MKRSLFILASCAFLSSVVHAENTYDREQVLSFFAKYNPVVLERAEQNEMYKSVLDGLANSFQENQTQVDFFDMIALTRNFDNSIQLATATSLYRDAYRYNQQSGAESFSPVTNQFHSEILSIFQNIWAVTIQVHQLRLDDYENQLKQLKKDESLSKDEKKEKIQILKNNIRALKKEIKRLQKNTGEQLVSATDMYVKQIQQEVSSQLIGSEKQADEAPQVENLSVTSKNKKRVAK